MTDNFLSRLLPWAAVLAVLALGSGNTAYTLANPANLFVAPEGSDENPGTAERPLATLAQARHRVRELLAHQPQSVRVELRGGVYRLTEPVVFGPADAAPPGHTITYAASPGAAVVLSGGEPLGNWSEAGGVWQARLPAAEGRVPPRDLYVKGERRVLARSPNEGYYRLEKSGPDRRTSFFYRVGELRPEADLATAEVVFLHDWSTSIIRVKGVDEAARQLFVTDPIGPGAPHYAIDHFEPQPRYFLQGARSLLDAPGEWHFEAATGTVSYVPRPGEILAGFTAEFPRLEQLLAVRGETGEQGRVRGLRFEGLTFAGTHWSPPQRGYAGSQATFCENRDRPPSEPFLPHARLAPAAAIKLDFASECVFENCRFEHLGGTGLWAEKECRDCRLVNCTVTDVAGNGIMIGETASRPDDRVARGNSVEGCRISRCGVIYYGAVGVWIGLASQTVIRQNEISELPYTGISLGWNWSTQPTSCGGNQVRENHIHHVMLVLSDGGGIYTLGRQPGTVLAGNHIHHVQRNAGRAESNGMFLDEGTSEILVEENLIHHVDRSPIRFHKATGVTLRKNRLLMNAGVPAFRFNNSDPASHAFIENQEQAAPASESAEPAPNDPALKAGPATGNATGA